MIGSLLASLRANIIDLWVPPQGGRREGPLDGIRALAAIWVVAFHVLFFILINGSYGLPEGFLKFTRSDWTSLILGGTLGVDMFFILSGYLIMSILVQELLKKSQLKKTSLNNSDQGKSDESTRLIHIDDTPSAKEYALRILKFFAKRYFRIMPAYATFFIVNYILVVQVSEKPCPRIWSHVIFLNNFWVPNNLDVCMGWSWSIAVEFQMYLLSPLIAWIGAFHPRFLHPLLLLLSAASVATMLAMGWGNSDDVVYYHTYTRLFSYLFGMMLAFQIRRERGLLASQKPEEQRRSRPWWIVWPLRLLAFGLVGWGATWTAFIDQFEDVTISTFFKSIPFGIGMTWIMYELLSPVHTEDLFKRGLNWMLSMRIFYLLAQLSYSIYLVHPIFMNHLYASFDFVAGWEWNYSVYFLLFLIYFSLASLTAVLAFVLVERPFIRLGNHLFGNRAD